MTSTGKGRLYNVSRFRTLRGRIGLANVDVTAATIANDTFWGGFPPTPTVIPYSWLTPPARWRSDQPRNVAQITRTGGGTARAVNAASVAAVGERPFTATLDTRVVDDPANYAAWIVANYTSPRQRMPQLRLNLAARTPTECWRILEREIGDRISITGAPGESKLLNVNPYFDVDASDWIGQSGATIARSTAFVRSGSGSLQITPPGSVNPIGARTSLYPIVPGRTYTAAAWLFSVAGWSDARACIDWYDSSGSFVSTGLGSATVLPASVWTLSSQVLTPPAGAANAALRVRMGATPSGSDILYADEVTLTGPDGTRNPWPAGITELVVEGIEHSIDAAGTRWVVWNTAPLIGAAAGTAGPWFRADQSTTDTGSDVLAF